MPLIGFSNEDIDLALMGGTMTTANVGYDLDIVKTAVQTNSPTTEAWRIYLTEAKWGGAARASFRFQFAYRFEVGSFATYPGQTLVLKSISSGLDLFRIAVVPGQSRNFQLQYNSSSVVGAPTWVNVGAAQTEPDGIHIYTVTVNIADAGGILDVHRDGILIASLGGGDTKFIGVSTIDCIAGWPVSNSTGFGGFNFWSQFILGTVDYLTYGLQVANPPIDAAGAVATQDSGAYTDVNEPILNRANGITLDTVGDGFSGTVQNLAGAAATAPIMALRVAADVRRGSSGPNKVKLFVRVGGTNYYSPALDVEGVGFVGVAYVWELNPATVLPWTVAEFNAVEIGVEAA